MFLHKYFLVLPVVLVLLLTPIVAFAASTDTEIQKACATAAQNGGEQPSYCANINNSASKDDPLTGPGGLLTTVTNLIAYAAGIVAVAIIIIAGGRLVISRGDSAKVVTARQTIVYALVGLVVIIIARQVIVFILTRI
jgi:hypothetical protein